MTHHPSKGTVVSWDPAGGTSYAAVGQLKDIQVISASRSSFDTTDHDSVGYYREFVPGMVDPGELTFTIGFDYQNTTHTGGTGTGLLGDLEQYGCDIPTWKVVLDHCGGTATWTFDGFVSGFTVNHPVEGEVTADVTVKVSGKPSLSVP